MYQDKVIQIINTAIRNKIGSLDLSKKGLASLPLEIMRLIKLKRLYLIENELTELPPEIGQLTSLIRLDLRSNRINLLPSEVGNLSNLELFDISKNELTALPSQIGNLTNLKRLDLSNNSLTELPIELGNLRNVYMLDLSSNKLTSIPSTIGNLTNLPGLNLSGNLLNVLPPEIGNLTNLTVLNLSGNLLSTLPPEIGDLKKLQTLNVSNNLLVTLPVELGKIPSLSRVHLDCNTLISPPPEIIEQGTKAILSYLREQLQGGRRQWISKLLVVGEGGVGKTSLLRSLNGETFDTEESTTHGIEIKSLLLKHPAESDVTMHLNTWDFGGQEIYHATHQFFLTNRSLFLLAWNARHGFEQGKLYYWLDTIKARAPESPVLIVATFIDERDANIPLADLRRKYPQIIGHYEVSNKTGLGIEELRTAITSAAAGLPLMGESWPINWLNAANAIRLRAKTDNHITPKQLWKIMAEHGVSFNKALILAQWLHELGDILYFRDDEELNDIVILNPQWVTQSISKVLESEEVIDNLGLFTRDHMNQLWQDIDLAMRDHFLRLMEKFDLSYRTLENRDISLVVERLNLDPPDYETKWKEIKQKGICNEIAMKFELDTTMPAGVPTWFIARSHRFTTRTHWRYGALFADGPERKHLGLIQAFPHDRYLQLIARGPTPHNFFALLWDGLEVTLKRFPGIKINRKIPCLGHNGRSCSHEFEFTHLQKRIEREPPKWDIECPVAAENISVSSLLFGLHWNLTSEILSGFDKLEYSFTEHQGELLNELNHLKSDVDELRGLVQREFTKLFYREQSKIESYCPNVFVLRPPESANWLKNIFDEEMNLQLYCQEPSQWHPAEVGGLYKVHRPAEWLQTMAPYISKMVTALKYAAPLIGPWIGLLSPEQFEKNFKDDIRLMEELVKKLPDIDTTEPETFDDPRLSVTFEDSSTERVEGAALRSLRRLLDKEDPKQRWGGLKRVLTPEGHYLWLCQYHAAKYLQ